MLLVAIGGVGDFVSKQVIYHIQLPHQVADRTRIHSFVPIHVLKSFSSAKAKFVESGDPAQRLQVGWGKRRTL